MGVFYTALSAILYGCIGYYGANLMASGFTVASMLFWRFAVSLLMLLPLLCWLPRENPSSTLKSGLALFISGLFYGGGTACYFEASRTIGTGLAMVLFFSYPIFVAIFSIIFKKSYLNLPMMLALLFIVVGSSLIAFGEKSQVAIDWTGISYALLSGFSYGCYVFGSKECSQKISPLASAIVVCAGNTLAFTIYLWLVDEAYLYSGSP